MRSLRVMRVRKFDLWVPDVGRLDAVESGNRQFHRCLGTGASEECRNTGLRPSAVKTRSSAQRARGPTDFTCQVLRRTTLSAPVSEARLKTSYAASKSSIPKW